MHEHLDRADEEGVVVGDGEGVDFRCAQSAPQPHHERVVAIRCAQLVARPQVARL